MSSIKNQEVISMKFVQVPIAEENPDSLVHYKESRSPRFQPWVEGISNKIPTGDSPG